MRRRTALIGLTAITVFGAALRLYGIRWAAPYFHFHMDEHYVFLGATKLRESTQAAADLYKFFMYPPLVMHLVNAARTVYEWFGGPLDLTHTPGGVTYMVMGRTISALFGTATIPLVYRIAARVSGRAAGLLAAFLLAVTVLHLRDSHFFTTDIAMVFFTVVTWSLLFRILDGVSAARAIQTGIGFGMAVAGKYTAVFLAPLIGLAHVLAAPIEELRTARPWVRRLLLAAGAGAVGVVVFLLIDPLVVMYPDRFRQDIQEQVVGPVLGDDQARQFFAQFGDVHIKGYWFTNLLWWGLGPALEIWALIGVAWLLLRRDRVAFLAGAFPVVFWLVGSRSVVPFPRYALPLTAPLAVCAAALSVDWFKRPRLRWVSLIGTTIVIVTTTFWALAYMNVYRHLDSRLEAGRWAMQNIPQGAHVLVEPSQGTPPMGSYFENVDFNHDYVVWRDEERDDYFHLIGLDMYRSLWNRGVTDDWRREYIKTRLAMADWIVMDDHYLVQYSHQPEGEHSVVKQYYRDLFDGKLDFRLVKTFKVSPSLFGITINDDNAELTWHDLDHPRVYVFRRFRGP
jgi:4-amino-4-deoxy-L-arabinose transferase-like glycosyltransferase